jgi:hypothetical protein
VSPSIWISCAGPSRARPLQGVVWRVVEAQHRVSTRKLVDTLEEQELLEEIIDEVKPPAATGAAFQGLDYLLSTPFRHPPLRHGSRFGRSDARSLFYGSEAVETSLAEKSYYALLFVAGTAADLEKTEVDWTAFSVGVRGDRGMDLCAPPFDAHRAAISSPTSYAASQELGTAMRGAGVELFRFASARCPRQGRNIALFQPVFTEKTPRPPLRTWRCLLTRASCEVFDLNSARRTVLAFPRELFEVKGRLPHPAV